MVVVGLLDPVASDYGVFAVGVVAFVGGEVDFFEEPGGCGRLAGWSSSLRVVRTSAHDA